MTTHNSEVTLNEEEGRFELITDGKLSILEYQPVGDAILALTHTEVPASLEGQGVGTRLVRGVFDYLEEHGLKMVPLCPFVAIYLKRHPEYDRLVSK